MMGMYKIFGTDRRGRLRWLCNMRASSGDEALSRAKAIYGSLYVTGCQGYNDMCEDCSLLGRECEGSHSQVWTGCVKRKEEENKMLFPGDKIEARGKAVYVSVILAQDYHKGVWDVEFQDEKGQYHHWKSDYDGGRVIPGPVVICENKREADEE